MTTPLNIVAAGSQPVLSAMQAMPARAGRGEAGLPMPLPPAGAGGRWLPRGGGATGELVRALDWSHTALGSMGQWTPALRTTVDIVLNSPIAMVLMWGPAHTMVYNDGYAVIAGGRHPAALGATVPAIWPEVWDWNRDILAAGLQGETRQSNGTCMTLLRNGTPEEVWFDLFYTPVPDTDGTIGGVLCTVIDVTARMQEERRLRQDSALLHERQQMQQSLRDSQERLAAIFGQAYVGLSELSLDGRFQRVNGALCHMLGRTEQDLLGRHMDELIHPEEMAENRALVARLVRDGIPFTLEKRYQRADGGWTWIASSMSRLDDEQGRPQALIAVKADISERRRIEVALRDLNDTLEERVGREIAERDRAEEALRQSQKMEAVGQLTGGVAHDFNNVLQVISGNLQLLQQQLRANDVARLRLDMAMTAVERGAKVASQLLAFARRQPLQPVVADLGRLATAMGELLRRALGEAVQLDVAVAPGLWNTQVDPGQIENVILNLAINARDAMQGAGQLAITVENAELSELDVNNQVDVASGQYVMLSVADNGCGMAPEVARRAFEPFYTTKAEGEGSGLGLSMAYGFVKQSRGHIKLHSELGRGTTVQIYLPRCLMDAKEDSVSAPGPVLGGRETILAVEDEAAVRQVVVDMLSGLGYNVLQAADGEQALQLLQQGAAVDLLFTDVVMPGPLRSPDLVQQARALRPELAVLYTSGYPQDAIVHGGRLDAGLELLSKPYQRDVLARKLRQVLERRPRLAAPAPASAPSAVAPAAAQAAVARRILVVEDNPDALQMVCELVGMLGHAVQGAADGEQAWAMLQQQPFDLLFTDVSLPGMSGIELARKALGQQPLRIVFSTGFGRDTLAQLGFPAGILRKPYELDELKAVLDASA